MEEKNCFRRSREESLSQNSFSHGENSVKLSLQPLHEEKVESLVQIPDEERMRLPESEEELSPEQKVREAEAMAKVLLLQKESEEERHVGLFLPLRFGLLILFLILLFVFLHLLAGIWSSRVPGISGVLPASGEKVEQLKK